MNDVFTVAGIGIISTGFILILKQYKPELAFGAALAAGIVLFLYTATMLSDIFEHVQKLVSISGIDNGKYKILLRCLGICMVTKIASETCNDCGQGSISSKIDFAGKIIVLFISLPLFSEILEIIKNLMSI